MFSKQYFGVLIKRINPLGTVGRAAGRHPRRLGLLGLALLVVPTLIVWAHHLPFTDVPTSGPLHDAVGAIYGARITAGTSATTYSPDDPTTRGQMAFFLHRGLGRVAFTTGTISALSNTEQDIATLTINTGGATGGNGFVKVDANLLAQINQTTGCTPCVIQYRITRDGGSGSVTRNITLDNAAVGSLRTSSGSLTFVTQVPTGTTQTLRLKVLLFQGTGTVIGLADFSAVYIPFGGTGADTLSAAPHNEQELPAVPPTEPPQ